jgi:transcriptional regulator with XRE-family HTH domain
MPERNGKTSSDMRRNGIDMDKKKRLKLGRNIRVRRLEKNMDQRSCARRARMSQPMLCQIESGIRAPSDESLGRIARVFQITKEELFSDSVTVKL